MAAAVAFVETFVVVVVVVANVVDAHPEHRRDGRADVRPDKVRLPEHQSIKQSINQSIINHPSIYHPPPTIRPSSAIHPSIHPFVFRTSPNMSRKQKH